MQVKIAKTYWQRLRGLIGSRLDTGEALLIPYCNRVHTFFMKDPIDVIFLDLENRVLSIHTLSPWQISPRIQGTFSILEMPARGPKQENFKVGDKLDFSL